MLSNDPCIYVDELQFKQLQQRNVKKFGLRRDWNPRLPNTRRALLTTELRSHTLGLGHTLEGSSFPWRNLIINFDEINFIHLLLLYNALLCFHKAVVQLGNTHYSVWERRFITDIRWCLVPLSKISVTAYHESPIAKRLEPPKYLAKDRRLDSYWEHLGVLFLRVCLFHSLNNIFLQLETCWFKNLLYL